MQVLLPALHPSIASPETLDIPAIHVHTHIESVGLDQQRRMSVPKNPIEVAWYDLGPKPGESGNAAIDGHIDLPSGAPSVFAHLNQLHVGDEIDVTDSEGKVHQFKVDHLTTYSTRNFPIAIVFGEANNPNLNLITCAGSWDTYEGTYNERLVVFTHLVQ